MLTAPFSPLTKQIMFSALLLTDSSAATSTNSTWQNTTVAANTLQDGIHQQSTINNQQATINNQQSTINNQQATSNKQQSTINKQQASSNKQQATSNKQQATRKDSDGAMGKASKLGYIQNDGDWCLPSLCWSNYVIM
jgi:hypothetical protein